MIRSFRLDRGTLRAAGFVALLTVVFVVTNTSVAAAAETTAVGEGLLGPLDALTREGAPLSGYRLESVVGDPGGIPAVDMVESGIATAQNGGVPDFDIIEHTQRLVMSGLFTLIRLLVGLCCWLIGFTFRFPLLTWLIDPAQRLADAYQRHVVTPLGLEGLLLAWAFVFGLVLFVRGKVGKGLGEIALTLLIAALAASAFVRPDYLLGKDGFLDQTHQAAVEVASITTDSYFGTPARGGRPCDSAVGPAHEACVNEKADAKAVTGPIQAALTDALVVKPYMLLQYGRVLDPKNPGDAAAYKAHLTWVKSALPKASTPQPGTEGSGGKANPCEGTFGPVKDACEDRIRGNPDCKLLFGSAKERCEEQREASKTDPCGLLTGTSKTACREQYPCASMPDKARTFCENGNGPRTEEGGNAFATLLKDLDGAGPVGKACAAYAKAPSWDRVWSAVALLIAVAVVTLMIVSMAVVMLGAQGADAATAAAGPVVWVWAMLPGPSRMVLWRWWGVFVVSALVSFMAAMCLPLFGIAVDALLTGDGPDLMVERLLLVDALAVAFLVMHRRVLAAAASFGTKMADRMRFATIGGSHLRGDNSEFGAALALNGPHAAGGAGGSAAHGLFGARLRSLGSLAALSDGSGMPMSPGRLLGDALAEGKRGLAPIALALRGAHSALVGPKPGTHPAARLLAGAAGTPNTPRPTPGEEEMVVDRWTGEILHDPATDRPLLGSRLHARASRLRGYRVASRTARLAYGSTLGLPRNLAHARTNASQFTDDARTQLRVAAHQVREDSGRWMAGVDHAGQRIATSWQVHDPIGAVRDTTVAAVIAAGPLTTRTSPSPTARTVVSAPLSTGRPTPPRSTAGPATGTGASTAPAASRRASSSPAGDGASGSDTGGRADANAARLRAIFESHVAERRRREEGDRS
ncbi:hypothetical protein [Streptomyces sp. RerS4]|uniref:hypothetical protein n=1 Tax=Streptomyces sp. RerS4 TaxID=2942449 RepID=UPI00201C4C61|nr:hypothetical protein [Streptomyces sp. RerS4]UQW99124.1 hypothetical protein M4D82_00145 [Streptomyces sp. RerS4]